MSYECNICRKTVRSLPSLNMHKSMTHKEKMQTQPILVQQKQPIKIVTETKYEDKDNKQETKEKLITCPVCEEKYTKNDLEYHDGSLLDLDYNEAGYYCTNHWWSHVRVLDENGEIIKE